jgi:hypothetical protein
LLLHQAVSDGIIEVHGDTSFLNFGIECPLNLSFA